MKRSLWLWCLAATAALGTAALGETPGRARILSGQEAASELTLRDLEVGGDGSVSGTLVNGSDAIVRDVELLVNHVWAWRDELHPGDDSPGRASYVPVRGEVPARGSLAFSYTPDPPLPKRTDGSFSTTVAVQSFTEIRD